MAVEIPWVDISPAAHADRATRQEIAARINAALRTMGFFVITGHGVPDDLVNRAVGAVTMFFELPLEQKLRVESDSTGSARGFVPYGREAVSHSIGIASPPDLKERFGIGPIEDCARDELAIETGILGARNRWPLEPTAFRPALTQYYRAMERLSERFFGLFAAALGLPESYFNQRLNGHNSTLSLISYPPQTEPPQLGQLRAGPHTDFGALTILLCQNKPGGLQVRKPDGEWVDVWAPPRSFVINIGDLLSRWSNDVWLSNLHRVANPSPESGGGSHRVSIGYFCSPGDAVLIECLPTCHGADRPARYAPITAGQHRLEKIRRSRETGIATGAVARLV